MIKWIMVFIVLVFIILLNICLALITAPNTLFNVIGAIGIVTLLVLCVKTKCFTTLFEKSEDKLR